MSSAAQLIEAAAKAQEVFDLDELEDFAKRQSTKLEILEGHSKECGSREFEKFVDREGAFVYKCRLCKQELLQESQP